jgi:hypothetical protein
MNSETWLDKAARLHAEIVPPGHGARETDEQAAARDRVKIALWLRREFSTGDEQSNAAKVLPFAIGAEE